MHEVGASGIQFKSLGKAIDTIALRQAISGSRIDIMKKLLCALMIGALAAGVGGMAFASKNVKGIDVVVKRQG